MIQIVKTGCGNPHLESRDQSVRHESSAHSMR
jgi:hypothetical protein